MRDYLQIGNLKQAAMLGSVVAAAAVPRILSSGIAVELLVPTAFFAMALVAGAVTAWGGDGGMVGAFPEWRVTRRGLLLALGIGLVLGIGRALWGDQALRAELAEGSLAYTLRFPESVPDKLALVLWTAGFQVLFFQAGFMSFVARVTGRWEVGLVLLGAFRIFVTFLQMEQLGIDHIRSVYLITVLATLTGATLFARCGLLPAVLFAALLESRLFLMP